MFEICKYLDICEQDNIPDGILVEKCDSVEASLANYVIICRTHNLEDVKHWINENIKNNVEHCLNLFEQSPERLFQYFLVYHGVQSYTYEFIKDSGGVQSFFDKYIAPLQLAKNNVSKNTTYETFKQDEETESNEDDTANSSENDTVDSSENDTVDSSENDTVDSSENDTVKSNENNVDDAISADGVQETESEKLNEQNTEPASFVEFDKEQMRMEIKKELEEEIREEIKTKLEAELLEEFHEKTVNQCNESEEDVDENKNVKIEVKEFQEYNPELLLEISDENFNRTLEILTQLSEKFNLDGLDPKFILEQEDLDKVYDQLLKYPSSVFKAFILDLVKGEKKPLALCRITVLLDDFVNFVNEEEN